MGDSAGVFYLHSDIGLPLRKTHFRTSGFGGTAKDYASKVYRAPLLKTSFPSRPYYSDAWDGHQALDLVWDIVQTHAKVERRRVNYSDVALQARMSQSTLVVNTIPLDALAHPEDGYTGKWNSQTVFIHTGVAPEHESYVIYSAHKDALWYRASAMFGRFVMEFQTKPSHEKAKVYPVKKVFPSSDALDCLGTLPNLLLTGRYGAWDKDKLSDSAYRDVSEWLALHR